MGFEGHVPLKVEQMISFALNDLELEILTASETDASSSHPS